MRPAETEKVVLVDLEDRGVGTAEKLDAHRPPGLLHRAVSAHIVDRAGRVLLQQRALGKYHFPGYWANACCSHPRPGESPIEAVERRVLEELGVRVPLTPAGRFVYRATDPWSGLVEHELDHVFVGVVHEALTPDPREVRATAFVEGSGLRGFLDDPAHAVAPWLTPVLRVAGVSTDPATATSLAT
jgi:isopentenyl-diphosphate delta-isomerase